jgi:hypothetical protein
MGIVREKGGGKGEQVSDGRRVAGFQCSVFREEEELGQ